MSDQGSGTPSGDEWDPELTIRRPAPAPPAPAQEPVPQPQPVTTGVEPESPPVPSADGSTLADDPLIRPHPSEVTQVGVDPPTVEVQAANTRSLPAIGDTAIRPAGLLPPPDPGARAAPLPPPAPGPSPALHHLPPPVGPPVATPVAFLPPPVGPPVATPVAFLPPPVGAPLVAPPPTGAAGDNPHALALPPPAGAPVALPPPTPAPPPVGAPVALLPPPAGVPVALPSPAPTPAPGYAPTPMPPPSSVFAPPMPPAPAAPPTSRPTPGPPPFGPVANRGRGPVVAVAVLGALVLLVGGAILGVAVLGKSASESFEAVSSSIPGGADGSATGAAPPTAPVTSTTQAPPPQVIVTPAQVAALDLPTLADQLSLVELTILDTTSTAPDVAAAAHTEQLIFYRLDKDPALAGQVVPLLGPSIRGPVDRYLAAGRTIQSLVEPQTSYPASWRIVAPPPAEQLRSFFEEAEAASGIPWPYFAAIAAVETRMGRIQGDSSAGAQGPMQFLPATWAAYGNGGDIRDFRDSVLGAARLLVANGAPGDMRSALYSYNHSDSYVQAVERTVARIRENDRYFLATYGWQVLYKHVNGMTVLPEGWPEVPEQIVSPLLG